MEEVWKDIYGWPGYEVSTLGRVMSYKYKEPRILIPNENDRGYYSVKLYKNSNSKIYRVNRLVAITYLPNFYNLPEVDHKDRNRQNNSLYNLKWVTKSENIENQINYISEITEKDPVKRNKLYRQLIKDSKKYYCHVCDFSFECDKDLQRHVECMNHQEMCWLSLF
jgi:hypothetical protein